MKHPFEAILSSDCDTNTDSQTETPTRRQMIGRAVSASAAVAGLAGLVEVAAASPEGDAAKGGSSSKPSSTKPPKKEGGQGGVITTQAIGEEGGQLPPGVIQGGNTTKRLGEEGGLVTTQAIGEEGGNLPGGGTTKAVGEEGGFRRPPRKPQKFAVLKKHYDVAMKKDDAYAASSSFNMMRVHPEAKAHKVFLAKAEAAVTKAGSAILAEAKAAAKKGDINTAFEKTRSLEFYFAHVDVSMQASKFHVELRTNEKYKKGYKQAVREFAAKEQFSRAQLFKSATHKRQTYQGLVRHYGNTVYGKKAAEALKNMPAAKPKPNPGRVTTLAIGEEG